MCLKGTELAALEKQVDGWNVIQEHHLAKTFTFPDFREALKFVNKPRDSTTWNLLRIDLKR
jgi:4a-hydroxytetrahydrobiopterin dehydratase